MLLNAYKLGISYCLNLLAMRSYQYSKFYKSSFLKFLDFIIFKGKIDFISSRINADTRSLLSRIKISNENLIIS